MGWKEGDGLGKDSDGMKNHVEIRPVVENRGLGCGHDLKSESHHQPDYEEILRSLNKKYSTKKLSGCCLFVTHPSNIETEGSLSETSKTCNNKDIKVQLGDLTVVSSSIEPSPCDILLKNTRNKRSRKHLDD